MSLNIGIAAAQKLVLLGYRLTVQGDTILADYQGSRKLDPAQVRPLLEVVKAHKDEVRRYLAQTQANIPSQPEQILSCNDCPWCRANPWTHYPDLPNWCGYHMDHLLKDNPQCIGYRRGEITNPPRKN